MQCAKDIMTPDPISARPEDDVLSAAKIMLEMRVNGLPVVDAQGALVGVITQSDLVAQQKNLRLPSMFAFLDSFVPLASMEKVEAEMQKITAMTVGQAMTPRPVSVHPDTPLEHVASLMVDGHYHTLPVVVDGKLVGIIGKEDVLRTLIPDLGRG